MTLLRCGVIGVGYLGRLHAQKYQMLPHIQLVGVCDINQTACDNVANECNVEAFYDYQALLGKVDAVSIAATTKTHYTIAKACLQQGLHVLLEKPMTETVEEADELIYLAKKHEVKLQIGHLERFNAARLALQPYLDTPLFIESQRLAPFTPRGADVNVVLDVMIHDIDLILSMVKSPIVHIEAQGAPVLSPSIDIANARITFQNQCVANITASRISFKTERKTRIFQKHSYVSLDYHKKQFALFKKGREEVFPGIPNVVKEEIVVENKDALLEEIRAFVDCILTNQTPLVSGKDGREALSTASTISNLIEIQLIPRQALHA